MSSERVQARPAPDEPSQRPAAAEARYSEDEVAEILRRAARSERERPPAHAGLTLAELESVARDAGLDPSLVRSAARSLATERDERTPAAVVFGGPFRRALEREVPGELEQLHHERVVPELRRLLAGPLGKSAEVAVFGRTLTSSTITGGASAEVTLAPREGRTSLRIELSFGPAAGGLYGGLFGGAVGSLLPVAVIGTLVAGWGAAGVITAVLTVTLGAFVFTRGLYGWWTRSSLRKWEKLADTLEQRVAAALRG